MEEIKQFEIKNPFTARLTPEEFQIFKESIIDIAPDIEPSDLNNRKILNRLIELAVSKGKKIFLKDPEHESRLKEIENLTNEIGRLKILNDQKDEAINKMSETFTYEKMELTRQLQDAIDNIEPIVENQVKLVIPPIIRKVLEIEVQAAKKKTGKEFSIEDILLNSFWDSVKIGCVYPYRVWSNSELSQLAKQLQSAEK